jgi:hypothetical protein
LRSSRRYRTSLYASGHKASSRRRLEPARLATIRAPLFMVTSTLLES